MGFSYGYDVEAGVIEIGDHTFRADVRSFPIVPVVPFAKVTRRQRFGYRCRAARLRLASWVAGFDVTDTY